MRRLFLESKGIAFLSLIILHCGLLRGEHITIDGRVTTYESEPVRYALVAFISNSDTFISITDGSGCYQINTESAIDERNRTIPTTIELFQNYPNPFTERTNIEYKVLKPEIVKFQIYNLLGQKVWEYEERARNTDKNVIRWDGRDRYGRKVAPGIYFCRMKAGKDVKIIKMLHGMNVTKSFTSFNKSSVFTNEKSLNKNFIKSNFHGLYKVIVENTDSTEPRIVYKEIENVEIHSDTLIELGVKKLEWRYLGLRGEAGIGSIAIDPEDPNTIFVGSLSDYSAGIPGKLFRSRDGGQTWDTLLVGGIMYRGRFRFITFDPVDHNTIYTSDDILLKSEDGGDTWHPINDGIHIDWETYVHCLAINSKNHKSLYAGTMGFYGGTLYRSYDGGLHWEEVNPGILDTMKAHPDTILYDGVVDIEIDPVDTNLIYLLDEWHGYVFKSSDYGKSWRALLNIESDRFGPRGSDLYIDFYNHNIIYLAGKEIYISYDYGITWTKIIDKGLPEKDPKVASGQMRKLIKIKNRLYIVTTRGVGGIYEYSPIQKKWLKIGIEGVDLYYYSPIVYDENSKKIYFGSSGSEGVFVFETD